MATETKDKMFSMKCEANLLKTFKEVCESNDRTASQTVRDFMREYIKKHRQGELKL